MSSPLTPQPLSPPIDRAGVRSVGVFHLNQLGDLMFSLPALAALRSGFSGAEVTSVVNRGLSELLSRSRLVDASITHRRSRDAFSTLRQLRRAELDLAVCLSQSPRVMALAWASGARYRVGFSGSAWSRLLTHRVEKTTVPSLANNLRLVEALGCRPDDRDYQGLISTTDDDHRDAARVLAEAGVPEGHRIVVAGPGASERRRNKEWPIERFLEVARHVTRRPGTAAVLVGAEARLDATDAADGVFDLGGRTSLPCLAALLARAQLFVGIDSGVLHLAAVMGAPCVAIFGPTDPKITGPRGTGHLVIHQTEAGGGLSALNPARVTAAVDELLAQCA